MIRSLRNHPVAAVVVLLAGAAFVTATLLYPLKSVDVPLLDPPRGSTAEAFKLVGSLLGAVTAPIAATIAFLAYRTNREALAANARVAQAQWRPLLVSVKRGEADKPKLVRMKWPRDSLPTEVEISSVEIRPSTVPELGSAGPHRVSLSVPVRSEGRGPAKLTEVSLRAEGSDHRVDGTYDTELLPVGDVDRLWFEVDDDHAAFAALVKAHRAGVWLVDVCYADLEGKQQALLSMTIGDFDHGARVTRQAHTLSND